MKAAIVTLLFGLSCVLGCTGAEGPLPADRDPSAEEAGTADTGAADGAAAADTRTVDGAADTGAADGAPPVSAKGPLAGMPSAPGPHIASIAALGDNQWLKLDTPAPDPKYGTARGRSWGRRALISAPELRGAFFMGEGAHGFVKPDGRAMDDIFVYDINANRWVAIYPGTDTSTFNARVKAGDLHIDDDNQVADETGQPIPGHVLIHAWDFLAYDPDAHQFSFLAGNGFFRYYLGGEAAMSEGLDLLDKQRVGKANPPMSPWLYDIASGRFQHHAITTPTPDVGGYANFEYIKSKKQFFYGGSSGVAFYDPATKVWTSVKDTGTRPFSYDNGGRYDPRRDRVMMGPGSGAPQGIFYLYDIATATWSTPAFKGTAPAAFQTSQAAIEYDAKSDVMNILHFGDAKIYTYDAATETFTDVPIPDEVMHTISWANYHVCYDEPLNVYFVYVAQDSGDVGTMWVYRYKK